MKYEFNCKIATQKIKEIKELKKKFDQDVSSGNYQVTEIMSELKKALESAEVIFDPDQITIRDELIREKGFTYIGKFNKYGLARASTKKMGLERSCELLINTHGEIVEPKIISDIVGTTIFEFSEGLAAVNVYNEFAYFLNEKGERHNNKTYRYIRSPYKSGVALVIKKRDVYSLIDSSGKVIKNISAKENMRWSEEGYLGFYDRDNGSWYITPEGKKIPKVGYFDQLGDLNNPCGVAGVQEWQGKQDSYSPYFYINQKGDRLTEGILSEKFSVITEFYQNRAFVRTLDGRQLLIDIHGNTIKEFPENTFGKLMVRHQYKEGMLKMNMQQRDNIYVINTEGEVVFSGFSEIEDFSEGMSAGIKDGKMYLLTKDGKMIEPETSFDKLEKGFKEGIAIASIVIRKVQDPDGFMKAIKDTFYIDKRGRRVFSSGKNVF